MDSNNKNIDNLIRSKFDSFAPTPPAHIWEGIEKGISSNQPLPFFSRKRIITASAILLLAIFGTMYIYNPLSTETVIENNPSGSQELVITQAEESTDPKIKETDEEIVTTVSKSESVIISDENNISTKEPVIEIEQIAVEEKASDVGVETQNESEIQKSISHNVISYNSGDEIDIVNYYMSSVSLRNSFIIDNDDNISFVPEDRSTISLPSDEFEPDLKSGKRNSAWKIGYFLAPELTISNIDSVEILNSYNLNIEPTYYFNDHWFVSSGIGLSYTRDRGFARIQYVVNEYMGSYDDVYEITFDTVSGNVVPTYHTKTVEIWDTVRHISVSSITNKYLYLHVPALFGYSHKASGSPVSWYVYGGPAVFFKTGGWIEDPKPKEENADIIELKNNLPVRANSYYQLWLGAGLQYELNKQFSLAVEPGYRHYLSNIYINTDNKGPTSGFTLRVGLVYKLK